MIKSNLRGWVGLGFGTTMGSNVNPVDMIVA